MSNRVVVAVCTLNYQKRMVDSLLSLPELKDIIGWAIPDSCLLPQVRNKAIETAYKNCPDFTHIMFIDDDMCGFGPQHVWQLLQRDVEVVSAIVTLRKPPYKIVVVFDTEDIEQIRGYINDREIKETQLIGMAFTLIKRSVLDSLGEMTPKGMLWFNCDRNPRKSFETEIEEFIRTEMNVIGSFHVNNVKDLLRHAVRFGQMSHYGTPLIGEDIGFSWKCRQLGIKMHVDCSVVIGHLAEHPVNVVDTFKALQNDINKVDHENINENASRIVVA